MVDGVGNAPVTERWYTFFAELAGVRAYGDGPYPQPKGLPDDISELTKYDIELGAWDHSHSWLSLDEFVAAYNRAIKKCPGHEQKEAHKAEAFGLPYWPWDDDVEYRVVFAFDN